jgi:hypothetical protein
MENSEFGAMVSDQPTPERRSMMGAYPARSEEGEAKAWGTLAGRSGWRAIDRRIRKAHLSWRAQQRTRALFELGVQIPRTNASLYPFAGTLVHGPANECERSANKFCECGLNAIPRRCDQEGMDENMVGAISTFDHTQEHFVQRRRMHRISFTSERTLHVLLSPAEIGAFHFFPDPVLTHHRSLARSMEKRTHPFSHFRATSTNACFARPAWVVSADARNAQGIVFLAVHSVREYPATRAPQGLPLTAHALVRNASTRSTRPRRHLK